MDISCVINGTFFEIPLKSFLRSLPFCRRNIHNNSLPMDRPLGTNAWTEVEGGGGAHVHSLVWHKVVYWQRKYAHGGCHARFSPFHFNLLFRFSPISGRFLGCPSIRPPDRKRPRGEFSDDEEFAPLVFYVHKIAPATEDFWTGRIIPKIRPPLQYADRNST